MFKYNYRTFRKTLVLVVVVLPYSLWLLPYTYNTPSQRHIEFCFNLIIFERRWLEFRANIATFCRMLVVFLCRVFGDMPVIHAHIYSNITKKMYTQNTTIHKNSHKANQKFPFRPSP